jgi:predicted transcriptional regulator
MNYEILELTSEIVSAYCSKNYLSTSELTFLIKEIADTLSKLNEAPSPKN